MDRNIIVTGGAGNLGRAVISKFKREGYKVIAVAEPGGEGELEDADDVYTLDVTEEKAVTEFANEYSVQYGGVDCIVLLVGGFAAGSIKDTVEHDLDRMFKLNFLSAFHMTRSFLPLMKKANRGCFLYVGARPAIERNEGKDALAYALSKKLVIELAEYVAEEGVNHNVRSHVFVPSIIDTPQNRKSMPDADFSKWVGAAEIADAMHYATNSGALRDTTFKLYGGV